MNKDEWSEKGPNKGYGIGDIVQAINLVGTNYKTISEAFKEYSSNAIDAVVKMYGESKKGKVIISIDETNGAIAVADNGIGMDYHRLGSVPKELFNSVKKNDASQIGAKHIGCLNFMKYGSRAIYYTKGYVNNDKNKATLDTILTLKMGRENASIPEQVTQFQITQQHVPSYISTFINAVKHGTVIYIDGINESAPDAMKKEFSVSTLKSFLQKRYQPFLEREAFEIFIHKYNAKGEFKEIKVEPKEFLGKEVECDSLDANWTDIGARNSASGIFQLRLFLQDQAGEKNKVAVYNKGVLIVDDITDIPLFKNRRPWNSGLLNGYIDESFLTLLGSRDMYETQTASFQGFMNALSELEKSIVIDIDRIKVAPIHNTTRVFDAAEYAFQRLNLGKYFRTKRISKPYNSLNGEEKDIEGVTAIDDLVETSRDGKKEIKTESPEVSEPRTPKSRTFKNNFNIGFTSLDQKLRSDKVGTTIYINNAHPDFQAYYEQQKDEFLRDDYVFRLFCSEIGRAAVAGEFEGERLANLDIPMVLQYAEMIGQDMYYTGVKHLQLLHRKRKSSK
ncbi:MAG: hypothetical protein WC916_00975 [Candidatus Woesearchaeota archaeon]